MRAMISLWLSAIGGRRFPQHVAPWLKQRRDLLRIDDVNPGAARLVSRKPQLHELAALGEVLVAPFLVFGLLAFVRLPLAGGLSGDVHVQQIVVAALPF